MSNVHTETVTFAELNTMMLSMGGLDMLPTVLAAIIPPPPDDAPPSAEASVTDMFEKAVNEKSPVELSLTIGIGIEARSWRVVIR